MRQVLLDTHVFLWMQFESGKLSKSVRDLMRKDEVKWHLSQVSVLEIQIKYDLGKLPLPEPPERFLPGLIKASGVAFQPLGNAAVFMQGKLPNVHRDPFDRLLVATALTEGWELATVDPQMAAYPVRIVG